MFRVKKMLLKEGRPSGAGVGVSQIENEGQTFSIFVYIQKAIKRKGSLLIVCCFLVDILIAELGPGLIV